MAPLHAALRPAARLFLAAAFLGGGVSALANPAAYPVTAPQKAQALRVAQQGVPLSELAPNAPAQYTVRRGDTLWRIARLFLRSPWRWPDLWGMNLDQIRNPHLIYPGQVLYLDTSSGRAFLSTQGGRDKLSPQVRSSPADDALFAFSPKDLDPFLNEAVILSHNELASAPRIVATQEGRVLLGRGDIAYVRGDHTPTGRQRIFRDPKPLTDPETQQVVGYEAVYVGTADFVRSGQAGAESRQEVPDTYQITATRLEAGVGDRLTDLAARDGGLYVPHAPQNELSGQVVSVYGEALLAGKNQVVVLNRGQQEGLERGHVLAVWRAGRLAVDSTSPTRETLRLPDERKGLAMVFRVFEHTAYAILLDAEDSIQRGDRFTQP